uniref:lipoprotein n=1 Tax=Thalassotalea algicola TaxID=2716224 RepID=UPI0038B5DFEB
MAIKITMNVKIKNLLICLLSLNFIVGCGLKGPLYQTPQKTEQTQKTTTDKGTDNQEQR